MGRIGALPNTELSAPITSLKVCINQLVTIPHRNDRKKEKHMNDFMTIKIEGRRLEDMAFQRAIISWKDKKERRYSSTENRSTIIVDHDWD